VPLFAGWIAGFVGTVAGWFAESLGKRFAFGLAYSAVLVAGWVALQLAAFALWTGLGFVMPPFMKTAMNIVLFILPSNTFACINAIIAVKLLTWVWQQQREHLRAISFVT